MNARKRCHRHSVAGKGDRDDTLVHSLPQSRPLADPAPSEREPLGVYHVLTQFVNHVPSQGFGGSKPPPYGVRFICLPVGTPLPGRPEKVAFGTVLPEEAYGIPPPPL